MFITLISAGNGGKVKPEPIERRIWSGTQPPGGNGGKAKPEPTERRIWSGTQPSAGNGGKAKLEPTERRIVSGDPPHGEFEAAHSRRTCKNGKFVVQ